MINLSSEEIINSRSDWNELFTIESFNEYKYEKTTIKSHKITTSLGKGVAYCNSELMACKIALMTYQLYNGYPVFCNHTTVIRKAYDLLGVPVTVWNSVRYYNLVTGDYVPVKLLDIEDCSKLKVINDHTTVVRYYCNKCHKYLDYECSIDEIPTMECIWCDSTDIELLDEKTYNKRSKER